jgi:hypothetical protein
VARRLLDERNLHIADSTRAGTLNRDTQSGQSRLSVPIGCPD